MNFSDFFSTSPTSTEARLRYEIARVSGLVTSQTRGWLECQGVMVIPSGHVPSKSESPDGSKREGILAVVRVQCRIALIDACLGNLPSPCLQLSPRVLLESTSESQ